MKYILLDINKCKEEGKSKKEGVGDCWCDVEQRRLLILNKGIQHAPQKQKTIGGNKSTGWQLPGEKHSRLGRGNIKIKWGTCLAYDRKNYVEIKVQRDRWASALKLDFYCE